MDTAQVAVTVIFTAVLGVGVGWALGRRDISRIQQELDEANAVIAKRREEKISENTPAKEAPAIDYESAEGNKRDNGEFYNTPYDKVLTETTEESDNKDEEDDEGPSEDEIPEGLVYDKEMGRLVCPPNEEFDEDQVNPYRIHEETFLRDERGYTRGSFVYFIKDDILVDDDQQVMNDYEPLFGHCLEDLDINDINIPNIIYIRNNRILSEYEVVIDQDDWVDVDLVNGYHGKR